MDAVVGTALASTAGQLALDSEIQVEPSVVAGLLAASAIYAISAATGASKYQECRKAKAEWHVNTALAKSNVRRQAESTQSPSPEASPDVPVDVAASSTASCTARSSQSMLKCVRAEAVCRWARTRLAAVKTEDCANGDNAWCIIVDGALRCFEHKDSCEARSAAVAETYRSCPALRDTHRAEVR